MQVLLQSIFLLLLFRQETSIAWLHNSNFANRRQFVRPSSTTALPAAAVVTLKIAVDETGAAADLAETKSERFTCGESLDMVHRLRSVSDAVLIGRQTVVADNPSLTIRRLSNWKGHPQQPLRVVLDPRLELLEPSSDDDNTTDWKHFQLFCDGYSTVLFHACPEESVCKDLPEPVCCVRVEVTDDKKLSLSAVLQKLESSFQVRHVMVEGGPATARKFLESQLVDRCIIVKAPMAFQEPLDAGLTRHVLENAGLKYLGSCPSGVDEIEYWSRPDLPWPSEELSQWP